MRISAKAMKKGMVRKMQKDRNFILIGYMGSGKSTIGKKAAKAFDYRFVDTDVCIEEQEGCTISELFAKKGEAYFRNCETELIKRLLSEPKGMVIATGGGLPVRPENAAVLKQLGTIVYLKTEPETLVRRLSGDTKRPLLSDGDLRGKIKSMLETRGPIYEAAADLCIATDSMSFYEMIGAIEKAGEPFL